MDDDADLKIWKYMDLTKFISLLTTKSLYFASPAQFEDLSEGSLPKSHAELLSKTFHDDYVAPLFLLRPQFAAQSQHALQQFDAAMERLAQGTPRVRRDATLRFGVNCWHKSEYESAAMWKLYSVSGQGIAIESTIGQFRAALGNVEGLIIDSVRYSDFNRDPIEKGHMHYGLFMKKKCFEHEKEFRATILLPQEQWQLPEKQRGLLVACDLDVLINIIHISPLLENYVVEAIRALCLGDSLVLNKPVRKSPLLKDSGYTVMVDRHPV